MIYEFENIDGSGERIERNIPMADAPPIGTTLVDAGKRYVRVPSCPRVATGTPLRGMVNYTLNPKEAAALGAEVNKDGYVCFESKSRQDEFVSRTHDTNSPVVNVR